MLAMCNDACSPSSSQNPASSGLIRSMTTLRGVGRCLHHQSTLPLWTGTGPDVPAAGCRMAGSGSGRRRTPRVRVHEPSCRAVGPRLAGSHMLTPSWDTLRLFLHVLAATIWVGGQLTLAPLVPTFRW